MGENDTGVNALATGVGSLVKLLEGMPFIDQRNVPSSQAEKKI